MKNENPKSIFGHHSEFMLCLDNCKPSAARKFLAGGQETLKTFKQILKILLKIGVIFQICHSYRDDKEFLNFVLPCLAKNGARIGSSCQVKNIFQKYF